MEIKALSDDIREKIKFEPCYPLHELSNPNLNNFMTPKCLYYRPAATNLVADRAARSAIEFWFKGSNSKSDDFGTFVEVMHQFDFRKRHYMLFATSLTNTASVELEHLARVPWTAVLDCDP